MSVPVLPCRTRDPRQNSWTIVPMTMPLRAKQRPELHSRTPIATTTPPVITPQVTGMRNWFLRFSTADLRQAMRGPMPVSASRIRPSGTSHLLKNGGPTVSRSPLTASAMVGNIVANRMKNAAKTRIQLFARNAASRDIQDSSSLRALSIGSR